MRTLLGVAKSPKAPAAARVAAANSLLDRGWGRPDQLHTGPDGGDIVVTIRQIIENVKVLDVTPEPVVVQAKYPDGEHPISNRMVDEQEVEQDQ